MRSEEIKQVYVTPDVSVCEARIKAVVCQSNNGSFGDMEQGEGFWSE